MCILECRTCVGRCVRARVLSCPRVCAWISSPSPLALILISNPRDFSSRGRSEAKPRQGGGSFRRSGSWMGEDGQRKEAGGGGWWMKVAGGWAMGDGRWASGRAQGKKGRERESFRKEGREGGRRTPPTHHPSNFRNPEGSLYQRLPELKRPRSTRHSRGFHLGHRDCV